MRRAALLSSTRSPQSATHFRGEIRARRPLVRNLRHGPHGDLQGAGSGIHPRQEDRAFEHSHVNHGLSWLHSLPDAEVRLPNSRREILPQPATP